MCEFYYQGQYHYIVKSQLVLFNMFQKVLPSVGTCIIALNVLMCSYAVEIYNSNVASTNYSCPPWYILDGEGKCSFSHELPQIVKQYGNTSELQMGFCIMLTNSSQIVSQCPYLPVNTHNLSQYHSIYQVLPNQLISEQLILHSF